MKPTHALYFTIAIVCSAIPTIANAMQPSDDDVESCINILRDAPSIFEGSIKFDGYNFSLIWLPSKETSDAFNQCWTTETAGSDMVKSIQNDKYSFRSQDFLDIKHNSSGRLRYLASNSYQRFYVLDLVEKRSYELVRIPPEGSIESMGTWNGTFKDPLGGCKNSWGDDCGTKYSKDPRTGKYDKVQ